MAKKSRVIYFFGNGKAEGNKEMKAMLGGKGANLAEMTRIGIPVPPGFTISTENCQEYERRGKTLWPSLKKEVESYMKRLEKTTGKGFGHPETPLLVSVRSGAASSMPGMMDTILNLGLNQQVLQGIIEKTGNERFAWDAYRRLFNMFGGVVMGIDHGKFEHAMNRVKERYHAKLDTDLDVAALKELCHAYNDLYQMETGKPFPQNPWDQLDAAIEAVFRSWNNERAITYRRLHKITGLLGTAVNIQAMVFGNMGNTSGTGVCFTRNPATGENKFYGEFLMNAQGEDVVAGIRTPQTIEELAKIMPQSYTELLQHRKTLEQHFRDIQDLEFTIENGILYLLQTRNGKRTAFSAVKVAVDMVREKLITRAEAIRRVAPEQLDQLLHPMFDPQAPKNVLSRGLPASPGAASGKLVFWAKDAEEWAARGEKVILARAATSPDDIGGMNAAQAILTTRGGMTSHAAVVGRGMGKCCVVGCGEALIDAHQKTLSIKGRTFREGEWVSLNGTTGEIMEGKIPTVQAELSGDFGTFMKWVDETRALKVRTNADTPHDSEVGRKFGAEGIGLCRTEHMFFEKERIPAMQEMILSTDAAGRKAALAKLLPMQREDFVGIFTAMDGLPVTIRLIDPPLHEFVPHEEDKQRELAARMNLSFEQVRQRVQSLSEANPMLGHRGCRLCVTYPEICDMQTRAIVEAAILCTRKGIKVLPEIMIPIVGMKEEFNYLEPLIRKLADDLIREAGVKLHYLVGTMIEIPRAALTAHEIADKAEFFSYGTNDLTQMTFGFSRDDVGVFLPDYLEKKILKDDPFQRLDESGVGQLVALGVERGRRVRPDLKIGICGEHGGEPHSVKFCHRIGLDYVSCSPYRVPIARLAAAQAQLETPRQAARTATPRTPKSRKASARSSARKLVAKATKKAKARRQLAMV